MNLIVLILGLLLLLSIYINYLFYRKENVYQEIIYKYELTIDDISNYMKIALENLTAIDKSHVYEAEDEVGWFFKTLRTVIIDLNNKIATTVNEQDKTDDENQKG